MFSYNWIGGYGFAYANFVTMITDMLKQGLIMDKRTLNWAVSQMVEAIQEAAEYYSKNTKDFGEDLGDVLKIIHSREERK